jgi:hypothetical protein
MVLLGEEPSRWFPQGLVADFQEFEEYLFVGLPAEKVSFRCQERSTVSVCFNVVHSASCRALGNAAAVFSNCRN